MATTARQNGKHPGGRPTKYKPEYCQEILEFFDVDHTREVEVKYIGKDGKEWSKFEERPNRLPWLTAFARKIGVTLKTLENWARDHAEFLRAFTQAKAMQAEMLHNNALLGLYNAPYAKLAAINITDWKSEKQEHTHGIDDDLGKLIKQLHEGTNGNGHSRSRLLPSQSDRLAAGELN